MSATLEQDEVFGSFQEEDSFVLETPFQIESYVSELNSSIFMVYVRGHKIVLENNPIFIEIVRAINKGEVLSIKSMISLSDETVTKDKIISLLNDFSRYHGIRKL